jgi:hypothetical protein
MFSGIATCGWLTFGYTEKDGVLCGRKPSLGAGAITVSEWPLVFVDKGGLKFGPKTGRRASGGAS